MTLTIETEKEDDGRWIAEILELPGVMLYGTSEGEAVQQVKALARRIAKGDLILRCGCPWSGRANEHDGR